MPAVDRFAPFLGILGILGTLCVCWCLLAARLPAADPPPAAMPADGLIAFDRPFAYAFASWQDKVQVVDGAARISGVDGKGGAGGKAPADLSAWADHSPVLRVATGPGNTAKTLRFRLIDDAGTSGTWIYALPGAAAEAVRLMPKDSASLEHPNERENKQVPGASPALRLSAITGWQLLGDWSGKGTLDVTVSSATHVAADDRMRDERRSAAATAEAEARRIAQEAADRSAAVARERDALVVRYGKSGPGSPAITDVSLVAPDVVAVEIAAQRVAPSTLAPYVAQPGDAQKPEKATPDRSTTMATLIRDGRSAGRLLGRKLDWLQTREGLLGDPLLEWLADEPGAWSIRSSDDAAYAEATAPASVSRKSKPTDWQQELNGYPVCHRIYLRLPRPLTVGRSYRLDVRGLNVRESSVPFTVDPRTRRSEAVHVNQIGFRGDDPDKRAFLSLWMGSGGGLAYPAGLGFAVVDERDGKEACRGVVELALAADANERLAGKDAPNTNRTAVHRMDFSALTAPGRYRVVVDGIGCSYPFEIGEDAWRTAFLTQMRGLYNNRGGVELGPPWTDFRKPRDFHPDDGTVVTRSRYDAMTKGDLKYAEWAKGDTGEPVADAWGGYHDAGDWNPRRVSHMKVTFAQLELVELFPAYFNALPLSIPPRDGIPDILTEALFEIDCFRRLQMSDGAIPYGIESDGDPLPGEISWLSSQKVMVGAPNIRDSWYYAAIAARAAKVLAPWKPDLAATYRESAERAFAWAEAEYARRKSSGGLDEYASSLWEAIDNRNLAALVLYDLSGMPDMHRVFLENTRLTSGDLELVWHGRYIQCDAAFLYARLPDAKADAGLKRKAIEAVRKQAAKSLDFAAGNAWSVTNKDKYRPVFCGYFSAPGGQELARAHYLTGERGYLAGAVRSCLFGAGCNPNNLVYTTGLGANPVTHPLQMDARMSGQPAPPGITVFGNIDYWNGPFPGWNWPIRYINKPATLWPDAYAWPLAEAYFDIYLYVAQNEYVVDAWAPNVFVWGYLAARGPLE